MARSVVTKGSLLKFDGIPELIGKFEKALDAASGSKGAALKDVYVSAALVIKDQIGANIQGMSGSAELKEVMNATLVVNAGPEDKPNAIVAMRQQAAIKRLGKGRSIPNPAWFEYGTVARQTGKGWNRGTIQPTPVFRPGIEQARPRAAKVLIDGISKVLLP